MTQASGRVRLEQPTPMLGHTVQQNRDPAQPLTDLEVQSLAGFAKASGRQWRRKLRELWARNKQGWTNHENTFTVTEKLLLGLEVLGEKWLVNYPLSLSSQPTTKPPESKAAENLDCKEVVNSMVTAFRCYVDVAYMLKDLEDNIKYRSWRRAESAYADAITLAREFELEQYARDEMEAHKQDLDRAYGQ